MERRIKKQEARIKDFGTAFISLDSLFLIPHSSHEAAPHQQ